MDRIETFEQFLATETANIEIWGFLLNLFLAALLAFILSEVYVRYGRSLSNRRVFSKNFVMVAMTTMVIITIVKSSLALSLGLVGALSIVRFRAAIKEPEELGYLFLNIAIGLGLGANQRLVTVTGFVAIIVTVYLLRSVHSRSRENSMHLAVSSGSKDKISLDGIVDILGRHTNGVELRRFNESSDSFEGVFEISLKDFGALDSLKAELQELEENINVVFIDKKYLTV